MSTAYHPVAYVPQISDVEPRFDPPTIHPTIGKYISEVWVLFYSFEFHGRSYESSMGESISITRMPAFRVKKILAPLCIGCLDHDAYFSVHS